MSERRTGYRPRLNFEEQKKIHELQLRRLLYPKYEEWEIQARAHIRAHIQVKMGMNFNDAVENAFVEGAKYQREKQRAVRIKPAFQPQPDSFES